MKRTLVLSAVCIVFILLLFACSQDDYMQETSLNTLGTGIVETPNGEEIKVVKELKSLADFNKDGDNETVRIVDFNGQHFELQVCGPDGNILWKTKATKEHVGWFSVFYCQMEGNDYLLEYTPYTADGNFVYEFSLFTIGEDGQEQIVETESVEFDTKFGTSEHKSFSPEDIAKFMGKINTYLANSIVLLNTNDKLNTESNNEINDRLWWLDETDGFQYDPSDDLNKILKDYKEYCQNSNR